MYRSVARRTLGLPPSFTEGDVESAFRARARVVHPDVGGDPGEFRLLVESRAVLLATLRQRHGVVVAKAGPRWWWFHKSVEGRHRRVV